MMTSAAETPSSLWMSTGMPRPLSRTVTEPSALQHHVDAVAIAGQRLVDGVVDDLVDHVVQARAVIGVADIHARALAHGVEAAQHLDRIGVVVLAVAGGSCGRSFMLDDSLSLKSQSRRDAAVGHGEEAAPAAQRPRTARRRCRSARPGRRAPGSRRTERRGARHRDGPRPRPAAAPARRRAAAASQPGTGQTGSRQQRLLLAGRALRRPASLEAMMAHGEIAAMRCRPAALPASASLRARAARRARAAVLGVQRRHRGEPALRPRRRAPGAARGKGPTPSRRRRSSRVHHLPARGGDGHAVARPCASSSAAEPVSAVAPGRRAAAGRARAWPARRRRRRAAWSGSKPVTSGRGSAAARTAPRRTAGPSAASATATRRCSAERGLAARPARRRCGTDAARSRAAVGRVAPGRGRCRCASSPCRRVERGVHRPGAAPALVRADAAPARPRRAGRGAGRGRAPGTRSLPADWSCRRRWGRSAPRGRGSSSSAELRG